MANEKNEKKEVAKKKAKGPGFFARIGKFFREVFGEVKKLSWPTKKELASYTLTVLVSADDVVLYKFGEKSSRSLRSSC